MPYSLMVLWAQPLIVAISTQSLRAKCRSSPKQYDLWRAIYELPSTPITTPEKLSRKRLGQ